MSTATPTVLEEILRDTRRELERRKAVRSLTDLEARLRESEDDDAGPAPGARFRAALARPGIDVIAEIKRRAPSAGALREGATVDEMVAAYVSGGASAISVLTEASRFGGSLEDLRRARELCDLPLLRKDFIVDPYQLLEARLAGADAVLLIVAALTAEELGALHEQAASLGVAALVEVHDDAELARALDAGAELIGINNRDLRDFSVDVERTFRLMEGIPAEVTVVSESGIGEPEQLRRLEAAGVDAVLVGAALMRSPDPAAALQNILATPR
jgi:indole-3-glycerol phosphate synthase